jgi:hypothetical protein
MRRLVLLLGLLTVGLAVLAPQAQATTPGGFTIARTADLGGVRAQFNAVTAPTAKNAWIVGNLRTINDPWALMEQWNGETWTRIGLPSLPSAATRSVLLDISSTTPTDAWAVGWSSTPRPKGSSGFNYRYRPLVYRRTAAGWQRVTIMVAGHPFNQVIAVSVASPTDVWALATRYPLCPQYVLHYNGVHWSLVGADTGATACHASHWTQITARNSAFAWAVGSGCADVQCNDLGAVTGCLGICPSNPGYGPVSGMSATFTGGAGTSSDFWALGSDGRTATPIAAHWDGTAWQDESPSFSYPTWHQILQGAVLPNGDLWAVGSRGVGRTARTFMLEHTAGGWSQVGSPNSGTGSNWLASIAHIRGTQTGMWAIGSFGFQPLLLHHS